VTQESFIHDFILMMSNEAISYCIYICHIYMRMSYIYEDVIYICHIYTRMSYIYVIYIWHIYMHNDYIVKRNFNVHVAYFLNWSKHIINYVDQCDKYTNLAKKSLNLWKINIELFLKHFSPLIINRTWLYILFFFTSIILYTIKTYYYYF